MKRRKGRQTPTKSYILPYKKSQGKVAVEIYEESGRKAIEWQKRLVKDVMAVDTKGLWKHQKFGFSVPRRNGKNEIVAIRELYGLRNGERICHTAHRTTTSHSAWERLVRLLADSGFEELGRAKKGEEPPEKSYRLTKQYGLESITLTGGGAAVFRTRTPNGGLGEGFDLLVIDEAQEYTDAQESALVYTVSDSSNPQTLFCGTPPTPISAGTVFLKMRNDALSGQSYDTGWAEWAIEEQTDDVENPDLWYETNPSMGYHLDERKVRAEIRGDKVDFNIQRLGLWLQYNQRSAISLAEWEALRVPAVPELCGKLYLGIKYGVDGAHVALSVAVRCTDGRVFVETIDCRPQAAGDAWILSFAERAEWQAALVDGANGQLLVDAMSAMRLKSPAIATVKEVVLANAAFEQALGARMICHMGQPSLTAAASNCDKRAIGAGGGFGYRSLKEDIEIAILDSVILAYRACVSNDKPVKKQVIRY